MSETESAPDNELAKPIRVVANGRLTQSETLTGSLDIPANTSVIYPLNQTFKEPRYPTGFSFVPPLPDDAFAGDIKIGKNSQIACSGQFKASLLTQLSEHEMLFDVAQTSMHISLSMAAGDTPYHGKVAFEVSADPRDNKRLVILPFNDRGASWSQVAGHVRKILVTPTVASLIGEGKLRVAFNETVLTQPHQDIPIAEPFKARFNGKYFEVFDAGLTQVSQGVLCRLDGEIPPGVDFYDFVALIEVLRGER